MIHSRVAKGLSAAIATILLSACGQFVAQKNARVPTGEEVFSSPKISVFDSTEVENTAQAAGLPNLIDSIKEGVIPAQAPLMVVVNKDCVESQVSDLVQEILSAARGPDLPDLKSQAYALVASRNIDLNQLAQDLNASACIERVGLDTVIQVSPSSEGPEFTAQMRPNDSLYSQQKHLKNIEAEMGWDKFYAGATAINKNTLTAVVDSGVDYNHPDLKANMCACGFDFVDNDSDPMDLNGHGTHVAGLIGATGNNGAGVAGVMFKNVKIMPVRVMDEKGSGALSKVVNGIRYAADKGAEVINLSLGASTKSQELLDALKYASKKGVVVLVAAGNDNKMISLFNPVSPAMYTRDVPGTMTIGSIDSETSNRSSFSNYGSLYVQLASPGSNGIVSTYPNNQYKALQGTSMATPIAAGAASLAIAILKSNNKSYTNADITALLTDSARQNFGLATYFKGGRQLNLKRLGELVQTRYFANAPSSQPQPGFPSFPSFPSFP